jgi:multidrug efflux pump subunit AcrB
MSAFLGDESRNPEVTDVLSYVGAGGPRFFLALKPNDPKPNKAFFVVSTKESAQLGFVMPRVEALLKRELPDATGRTETLFLGNSALGTVELQIRGPQIETLRRIGDEVTQAFHSVAGIESVRSDWENAVLKIRV